MSHTLAPVHPLPKLDDEILWKIFAKANPKTATKCRALSKRWNLRLKSRVWVEEDIPERVKTRFHTLSIVKDEVAFAYSFYESQFKTVVDVYQVTRNGSSGSRWGKLFRIPHMGVPLTPTMFVAKHDYEADRSTDLLSKTWDEIVHLKTVLMHSPGIYTVE
ncbi:hypothetical protein PIB30_039784 [Stylosanthes scabra]|uniref:F-box domain-containing protein n=1 Tax=Stylosanthes scabra TaxID=79078 RepID=A0ABU6WGJ9_9FABA|nr:hypothetical protein [Stylosanthes scabra]